LVALATLAVLLAGVLHGPPLRRALMVVAAVPLALAANAVRLTALLWVADTYGTESGLAFFHGPSSPMLFALAAGGLLAVTRSLGIDVQAAA
jgi:exosortase/archaeosortase family protein